MSYLYSQGVEHRDLKTLNVLLDASRRRCKVSDFGLSQSESLNTAATQSTAGGECEGDASVHGARAPGVEHVYRGDGRVRLRARHLGGANRGHPWRGLNPMQVGMQIPTKQARPAVPEGAPADLARSCNRCWAHEPDARPTFAAIKAELLGSGPETPAKVIRR